MRPVAAYDLDGVLAAPPSPPVAPWGKLDGAARRLRRRGLLEHYAAAPLLLDPEEDSFVVVSARREDRAVRRATVAWLARHFGGRCAQLFLLPVGRTLPAVVGFKFGVLAGAGCSEFTEDNVDVLRGLLRGGLACRLWVFDGLERRAYPQAAARGVPRLRNP